MSFENLVGNEKNKVIFNKIVKTNNVLHSYLFSGPEGVGKKEFAIEFSKMIMCLNDEKPCNNCKSCIQFQDNNNPDFKIIESEGTIKIEQIRNMQEKIYEKPINARKKIYIIDDAEKMTIEAQNCLLKTLEEPPEYIVIILISSNDNNLLNTIKSRCMEIDFKLIESNVLKKILEEKYEFQSISENMLKTFEGSIGKALKNKENTELYDELNQILDSFDKKSIINIINNSEIIYKNKEKIGDILNYFNIYFFERSKREINNSLIYLNAIKIVENTKERLKYNSNYDMSIDYLLINLWEELNK